MLSKTSMLEKCLISEISAGIRGPGEKIPSRNRLAVKYRCSRTTVERAVERLTEAGYLSSRKGSGTVVVSAAPDTGIRELRIVTPIGSTPDQNMGPLVFSEEWVGLPVRLIRPERASESMDLLTRPNGAVIWVMPGEEQILLMDHLSTCKIPQLLLNRDYRAYDCILTDPESSIREGLSWLLIESGREIAFLSRAPDTNLPYLHSRIIAFYRLCVELGAKLNADTMILRSFTDIPEEITEVAAALFGRGRPPKGIFVLNQELALPLAVTASGYGLTPGRDFRMLVFDDVPALANIPGLAMMRQPYQSFRHEISRWLDHVRNAVPGRFEVRLKTELITSSAD